MQRQKENDVALFVDRGFESEQESKTLSVKNIHLALEGIPKFVFRNSIGRSSNTETGRKEAKVVAKLNRFAQFQPVSVARLRIDRGKLNQRRDGLSGCTIVLVGVASVLLLIYFARKLERGRGWLFVPFLIALPFAYVGALAGGLLGYVGVVIFGLIPFIITLSIGYWIIKRLTGTSSVLPQTGL